MKSTSLAGVNALVAGADGRVALALLAFATGRSGRFQVAFLLLFFLSLLYVVRHDLTPSTYRRVVAANPFFAAFSVWWCISVAWANDLQAGVLDAAIFVTGWLALALCRRRLAVDTILWSMVAVSSVMAIAGLTLFAAEFQFVRSPSGDLAGLVGSKNHASFLSAMGLNALFGLWRRGRADLGLAATWSAPLAIALWLGNSEAAIAVVTAGLLVQLWLAADGRYRLARRCLILAATTILAVWLVPVASQSTGESASDGLAGRRPLWAAVWEETTEQPLRGWGPGIWRSPELRPAKTVVAAARAEFGVREVTYAHSTYLDVLLQTGWIGLVLFVAAMGQLLHRLRHHGEMAALVVGSLVAGIVATRFPNDLTTPILLFAIHLSAERPSRPTAAEQEDPVGIPG